MLRLLFRTAVAVLARTVLWMTFSAVLILGALRYGPTLLAAALPEDIRPAPEEIAKVTPQQILDALKGIRGALE
jgi:hypothetical protein